MLKWETLFFKIRINTSNWPEEFVYQEGRGGWQDGGGGGGGWDGGHKVFNKGWGGGYIFPSIILANHVLWLAFHLCWRELNVCNFGAPPLNYKTIRGGREKWILW